MGRFDMERVVVGGLIAGSDPRFGAIVREMDSREKNEGGQS